MKLPKVLEDCLSQMAALPTCTKEQAFLLRMVCECGYMSGLTQARDLAKADPTLDSLERVGTEAAIGGLDTIRDMFVAFAKPPASKDES